MVSTGSHVRATHAQNYYSDVPPSELVCHVVLPCNEATARTNNQPGASQMQAQAVSPRHEVAPGTARLQWLPLPTPSPSRPPPEHKLAVESQLDTSVYAFYHNFLSAEAHLMEDQYRATAYDVTATL